MREPCCSGKIRVFEGTWESQLMETSHWAAPSTSLLLYYSLYKIQVFLPGARGNTYACGCRSTHLFYMYTCASGHNFKPPGEGPEHSWCSSIVFTGNCPTLLVLFVCVWLCGCGSQEAGQTETTGLGKKGRLLFDEGPTSPAFFLSLSLVCEAEGNWNLL